MKKFSFLLIALFSLVASSCNLSQQSESSSEVNSNISSEEVSSEIKSESSSEIESIPSTEESISSDEVEDSSEPSESDIGCSTEDSEISSNEPTDSSEEVVEPIDPVDYVSQVKFDPNDTSKVYAEVTVKNFIDGDTTHFYPKGNPSNWIESEDGSLKARYNSCDTPESTGKVEPWGKKAAYFTRTALENAESIIIQSDTNKWETDSTGERYLVWVWYRNSATEDYKLLNLELIQEGLAKLKSASSYSLYETFSAANMQAMTLQYKVYSPEKDDWYYYGKAQSITMKELRLNVDTYKDTKISVEGLVTVYDKDSKMAYAESYDGETNRWYGMSFYLGFNTYPIIKVGNYLRLVGTLQYYELGESWQVSGLSYHRMDPDYEGSMKKLENVAPYDQVVAHEIDYNDLQTYGEVDLQSTYVSMNNLTVKDVYTTSSTDLTSNGAMTLTCKDENGNTVIVRTSVLKKSDNTLLAEEDVLNKTISVKGIVTTYNGKVQIHVYTLNELIIA